VHHLRDADAARFGECLQACRDVDPVAVDTTIGLYEDVAEVNADTKQHPSVGNPRLVPLRQLSLGGHGTQHGVRHTVEHPEHTIACGIHDAAVVGVEVPPENVVAFAQRGHGSWLVVTHQSAIPHDIGAQDGCQPANGLDHGSPLNSRMVLVQEQGQWR
jgi:hypothetical protein